jgi:hypothetical protein
MTDGNGTTTARQQHGNGFDIEDRENGDPSERRAASRRQGNAELIGRLGTSQREVT